MQQQVNRVLGTRFLLAFSSVLARHFNSQVLPRSTCAWYHTSMQIKVSCKYIPSHGLLQRTWDVPVGILSWTGEWWFTPMWILQNNNSLAELAFKHFQLRLLNLAVPQIPSLVMHKQPGCQSRNYNWHLVQGFPTIFCNYSIIQLTNRASDLFWCRILWWERNVLSIPSKWDL